jgi:16S rRNA U516 pseudouridylate synthase RsuA-like enzyme
MSEEKKMFLVETVSMFRHQYVVEAKDEEHALDEVTCYSTGGSNQLEEFSQKHLDEIIVSSRKINMKKYYKLFNKENGYLSSWTNEQKMRFINKIDYDEDEKETVTFKEDYFKENLK